MVAPLNSLMLSAQQIANNTKLSDDTFIYLKKGKLHTEGNLQHHFTFKSTKAHTSQKLCTAFREAYQDSSDAVRRDFLRTLDGRHQITVGELRKAFATAEAKKLATLTQSLSQKYGQAMGDALAPLAEHVKSGGSVTQKMIGKAMNQAFGKSTSQLVLGNLQGAYLENLTDLMEAAELAQDKASALRKKPLHLRKAVHDLCSQGEPTKENVMKALNKHYPSAVISQMKQDAAALSARPTFEEAMAFLEKAETVHNQAQLAKLQAKVGDDEALMDLFGLSKMIKDNLPLSLQDKTQIETQLPAMKAAARQLRSAANRYIENNPELSPDGCRHVKNLAEQYIREGRLTAAGLEDLKNEANVRKWRETNFEYAVNYEAQKHPQWSSKQKTFYTELMKRIHANHKHDQVFTKGSPTVADLVAKEVDKNPLAENMDDYSYKVLVVTTANRLDLQYFGEEFVMKYDPVRR